MLILYIYSDYLFKYLFIGNKYVGKASLNYRFVEDDFSDDFVTAKGAIWVDFRIKTIEINSKICKLQIWNPDKGGERFKNICLSYYRGADAIILTYDITSLETFENLNYWLTEIDKNAPKDVYKILVGAKCDLENKREISIQQGKDFAEKYNMKFFETSSKKSINVFELFTTLTKELIKIKEAKKCQNSKHNVISKNNNNSNKNKKRCSIF